MVWQHANRQLLSHRQWLGLGLGLVDGVDDLELSSCTDLTLFVEKNTVRSKRDFVSFLFLVVTLEVRTNCDTMELVDSVRMGSREHFLNAWAAESARSPRIGFAGSRRRSNVSCRRMERNTMNRRCGPKRSAPFKRWTSHILVLTSRCDRA